MNDSAVDHSLWETLPDQVIHGLVRIGGLNVHGYEGSHTVGDEWAPDKCPGCWAWWALFSTARPSKDELDALRAECAARGIETKV